MDSPNAIAIRPISAADADILGSFFETLDRDAETVRFFHPHPMTREFASELCGRIEQIKDRYFLAIEGTSVIGYSMLRGWDEGYRIPSFGACVHPERRNIGLGKQLLAHSIEQSRAAGAPQLRLTVFKANERAIAVYRRFGFVFTEKNADELIGLLDLNESASQAA